MTSFPKRIVVWAALSSTLIGCSVRGVPSTAPSDADGPLRIAATTSALPLVLEAISTYEGGALNVEVRTGNYRQAITMLLAGEVQLVVTTHLDAADAVRVWAAPVAQDAVTLVVHPSNPLEDISLSNARRLFQGQIGSWAELEGSDLPVTVVSREDGSGIRSQFDQLVMGTRATTGAAITAASTEGVLRQVAGDPNAIGYASLSSVDRSVRALAVEGVLPSLRTLSDNTYPLRSTVFVVAAAEPQGQARALTAWMQSPEGQAVISALFQPVVATPDGP